MRIKSTTVYDGLTMLIDSINLEPDPAVRLASFAYLVEKFGELVLPERDKAAYYARIAYAAADVERISGVRKDDIYYWARRHSATTGDPKINRRAIKDVSGAIDISQRIGVHKAQRRNPVES